MLGLRDRLEATQKVIPEIKVSSLEEGERERKIREIKEILKKRIQLRISQTANALRGFARQFKIEDVEGFGPREFMQISKPEVFRLERKS